MARPIVLIPARLKATRLPGKPLALIGTDPMIVHVWRRAVEADVGPVIVAAGDAEIVAAVEDAGGRAVLTHVDLPSGSDRIWQALQTIDPGERHDVVVNVQGDLPTLDPAIIRTTVDTLLADDAVDIATPVCEITRPEERTDPNVVKAAVAFDAGRTRSRVLYFSRTPVPFGDGPLYHHIGLYAYRRPALTAFVGWPPGLLEQRESLEQLRALENHLRIDAVRVDTVPLGVDGPDDLDRARSILAP